MDTTSVGTQPMEAQMETCNIYLVVGDLAVKYVGKKHAEYLLTCTLIYYPVSVEWTVELYYGVSLDWDYKNKHVTLSIPGYMESDMHEYQQKSPTIPHHVPQK